MKKGSVSEKNENKDLGEKIFKKGKGKEGENCKTTE